MDRRLLRVLDGLRATAARGAGVARRLRPPPPAWDLGRECDLRVDDWRLVAGQLRATAVPLAGSTFVELGPGPYAAVACCLFVAGAARVHAIDREARLDRARLDAAAERLAVHLPMIAREAGAAEREVATRHAALSRALAAGAPLAVATGAVCTYHAPIDPAATGLADGSVDAVVSTGFFDELPPLAAETWWAEVARILRPGGASVHLARRDPAELAAGARRAGLAVALEASRDGVAHVVACKP